MTHFIVVNQNGKKVLLVRDRKAYDLAVDIYMILLEIKQLLLSQ